jgi:type II secretion system (T2SS) protein K
MTRAELHTRRRGFALVAVLWIMASLFVLGAAISVAARTGVVAARNRMDLRRAEWQASGCAARARATIEAVLEEDSNRHVPDRTSAWQWLDTILASATSLANGCDIALRPSGTTFDVNADSGAGIRAVLLATGASSGTADSLAAALLDWRDADSIPNANGAERDWYLIHHRPLPRNGPIASIEELEQVRGFDAVPGLDSLFGVEHERILVARAPIAVLATLDGLDGDALTFIAEGRRLHRPGADLLSLAAELPQRSRANLATYYDRLAQRTTLVPEAWTLTSRATIGSPGITAVVELRLARAGGRTAIIRRRSWP